MTTENQNFTIVDYCFLDGSKVSNEDNWCYWAYQDPKDHQWTRKVFGEEKEHSATLTLFTDGDGGCVGGATSYYNGKYCDYWLKIQIPKNIARIENLKLCYNGGNRQREKWGAMVFTEFPPFLNSQSLEAPLSWGSKNFQTPLCEAAYSINKDNGEEYFNLTFDCTKQDGIYYINITQIGSITSAHYVNAQTNSNVWNLDIDEETKQVININYQLQYTDAYGVPSTYTVTKTSYVKDSYKILSADAIIGDDENTPPDDINYHEIPLLSQWQKKEEGKESQQRYTEDDEPTLFENLTLTMSLKPKSYVVSLIPQIQFFDKDQNNTKLEDSLLENPDIIKPVNEAKIAYGSDIHYWYDKNYYCFKDESPDQLTWEGVKIDDESDDKANIPVTLYPILYAAQLPNGEPKTYAHYELPSSWEYGAKIKEKDSKEEAQIIHTTIKIDSPKYQWNINSDSSSWRYDTDWPSPDKQSTIQEFLKRPIAQYKQDGDKSWTNGNGNIILRPKYPEGSPDDQQYLMYIVEYLSNGVYLDDDYQETLDNFIQLPYREDGTELFWSLTAKNGTPHYRSGDYVGTHKITKLWSTTENGSDYSIFIKKEDGWK